MVKISPSLKWHFFAELTEVDLGGPSDPDAFQKRQRVLFIG